MTRARIWIASAALAAALGAAGFALWPQLAPQSWAEWHLHRAEQAAQPEAARAELYLVLARQPRHLEARRRLAQLELKQGRAEQAFLQLQSMNQLHPEDAAGWLGTAKLMASGHALVEAERASNRAVDALPSWAEAYRTRAELRLQLGQLHGAMLDMQQAQKLGGDALRDWPLPALLAQRLQGGAAPRAGAAPAPAGDPLARASAWPGALASTLNNVLGKLRAKDGAGAAALAQQARKDYPASMFGGWLAGIVAFSEGQLDAAERAFREALALQPRSDHVLTGLTRAWSRQHGAAYAGEQLGLLAQGDAQFALAWQIAAHAYVEARQPAKAEALLRAGLALDPPAVAPYRELAALFVELDRGGEAIEICEQGLKIFSDDRELAVLLARLRVQQGDAPAAIALYEGVIARHPDDDAAAAALARLPGVGSARALQLAHDVELDAPGDAAVLADLGAVYLQQGDAAHAARLLRAAIAADPENPALHIDLARALLQLSRKDEASVELRKALESPQPYSGRLDAQRLLNGLEQKPR